MPRLFDEVPDLSTRTARRPRLADAGLPLQNADQLKAAAAADPSNRVIIRTYGRRMRIVLVRLALDSTSIALASPQDPAAVAVFPSMRTSLAAALRIAASDRIYFETGRLAPRK